MEYDYEMSVLVRFRNNQIFSPQSGPRPPYADVEGWTM